MIRRPTFSILLVSAIFVSAWQVVPGQDPKVGQQGGGQSHPQLEELQQQAKAKSWTFQVGHSKAADQPLELIAGTRIPPKVKAELPKIASHVNERGKEWLKADHSARDKFDAKHPGKLPGQQIEARKNPHSTVGKSRFDWRDYGKVTAVRDQGTCGSCWDFTAMGAFECNYLIRNNKTIDSSEQQILNCSGAGSCAGGWWMGVFDYLIKHGGGNESSDPYTGKEVTCKSITSPYKAISWGFVAPNGAKPDPNAIKEALCKHGPLAVAVYVTQAFQYYKGGVFNEHAPGAINHGVVLVGWDDSKGKNGAWAIRNSWGESWGEKGFMYIEYDCNNIGDHAAWVESRSEFYELMTLLANDYKVKQNQEVVVPIHLLHPTKVNNMDWTLQYNQSIVTLVEPKVVQGNLPLRLFEANPREVPLVRMGFAQQHPIEKDGTVSALRFRAIGAPGSITPLTLAVQKVNDPSHTPLPIRLVHGSIEIVKDHNEIPKGSCYGREYLGIEDARCALQMSVKNRDESLQMDMDNDNRVTSLDAAIIIQRVTNDTLAG